jgi:hypothetical protein
MRIRNFLVVLVMISLVMVGQLLFGAENQGILGIRPKKLEKSTECVQVEDLMPGGPAATAGIQFAGGRSLPERIRKSCRKLEVAYAESFRKW